MSKHPTAPTAAVVCTRTGFSWPDGTPVLDDFQFSVGPGRTGLVGLNGSGKSTLLKLIAGELTPTAGSVKVVGEVGYLPQHASLDTHLRVDEALGIAATRAALHAIENGDASEEHFTIVGDDWDVEERARATLDQLGLGALDLDRTIGEVSGGESVLLRLTALLLRRPDVLLLDEPTNNLDLPARRRLHDAVSAWSGVLVVVSHDRELLERVDRIADLRVTRGAARRESGGASAAGGGGRRVDAHWYGGNFTAYEQALAVEQEAAERMVRVAGADVARQRRELADAQVKLARRVRYGDKMYAQKREPKIVMNSRKGEAQVSAGKHRALHTERLQEARDRLDEATEAVRDDDEIRIDLPYTAVPPGRTVLTLTDLRTRYGTRADLEVRGPERIALTGRNGSGKTTLLRTLAGELPPAAGTAEVHVPHRFLPQRLDEVLDHDLTVVENVARYAPDATNNRIRARLARFLFKGARADQQTGTLSGGERFRAALAALMLAEPAPQLLLLDEPTNNLDMSSVRRLVTALHSFEGALLVVSHDHRFLRELSLTRWLTVESGGLTATDPL
ncbi:ABC-F family ATP-binding cassette domain-containing protein [Streptomyces noursei]|uniref:ABC-F family ATP-binding cassette domain-containing protein n=1 Tax=Streptomyces noursei TaxID=1971 RepID=UPI0016770C33|nr:ABC-F family ATP-binding cassette domain-containing protein [Streptomyces noursei]MCZ1014870.1 ABC-F family ATP-binding cassette domain-containing protein [Streptomyces noursei]GGX53322.1 ABC transporter [Streptomyces noursei]